MVEWSRRDKEYPCRREREKLREFDLYHFEIYNIRKDFATSNFDEMSLAEMRECHSYEWLLYHLR